MAQVQIIQPYQPQSDALEKVAAYCRVSTDSKDQLNSYRTQIGYYTNFIAQHPGWELADIYADEGITGTSLEKRDEFKRMLQDCRAGKIQRVLVKSVSRFARNTLELLETTRELKDLGVVVVFEEQGFDTSQMYGEMQLTLLAMAAQEESASISKNMRWSIQKRMDAGTYLGNTAPYGYRLEDGQLKIEETEATVVRRIFEMRLSGMGQVAITQELNRKRIQPRDGKPWTVYRVRYILSNERYIGDALLQKTYRPSLFSDRAVRNDGALKKYYIEDVLPRILEPDTFDRIQEELAKRGAKRPTSEKAKTPFGRYSGKYALSTLVVCGQCGALYRRVTWYRKGERKIVWRCGTRLDNKANCTQSPTLEERALQAAVMDAISQQYVHKDETIEVTMQSIRSVLTPETAGSEYAIRTKINELQKERKALLTKALAENDDGKYDFQFLRIKRELEQLQAQLEGVQAVQKAQAVDEVRMAEIAALLEKFKESDLSFDDLLVRKVVETVRVESAEKLEITFKDGNRRVVELPGRK